MDRIFTRLTAWLELLRSPDVPADPFAGMSLGELADLPVTHPAYYMDREKCGPGEVHRGFIAHP